MARDRGGDPRTAGDVVADLLGGPLGNGLTKSQRVARAWYAVNGDRERAHTTGVWLKEPTRPGADPTLVVRVDSGLLASELATNKDLYLSRLAFRGVRVSNVRFTVGGDPLPHIRKAKGEAKGGEGASPMRVDLTHEERARVDRATSGLPEGLRQSVSRAMCASLAREKCRSTQDG